MTDKSDKRDNTENFELPPMDEETARIVAEARRLPPLTPSRDLWPDIEARLGDQVGGQGRTEAAPSFRVLRWTARPVVRMAMAASVLIAVTAGITWQLARRGTDPSIAATPAPATPVAGTTPVQRVSLDQAVATMDVEIAQLEDLLQSRRTLLDPRTVQVLETNLALIDRAIAESRAALTADPASGFLATQYTRAYITKLTLLRDAASLPTGI